MSQGSAFKKNFSVNVALSSMLSEETSLRISGDTSLSTAIGSGGGFDPTSLTSAISSETFTRGSADTSLSSAISSESTTRESADTSLSTVVSTNTSKTISLSTSISSETFTRGSADTSLSTAVQNVNNLVEQIDFNLYVSGLSGSSILLTDYSWYAYTINNITYKTNAGTSSITIKNSATSITGMTTISGATINNSYEATSGNSVSVGNYVAIYLDSVTSCDEIYGSIKTTRN